MACSNPRYFADVVDSFGKNIAVACRNCMCCRQDYINSWNHRATYEQTRHPSNIGITLTYNDWWLGVECVKRGYRRASLRREHLNKYLDTVRHRIRKKYPLFGNYTFFASGEYGDRKNRPHFHIAFYGVPGYVANDIMRSSWHYGNVKVRPLKFGHVNYFLKYVVEDKIDKQFWMNKYFVRGMEFPFCTCSKGFGKGLYYDHMEEIQKYGMMKLGTRWISVPYYWRSKLMWFTDSAVRERDRFFREMRDRDVASHFNDGTTYNDIRAFRIVQRENSLIQKATQNMRPIPSSVRFRSDADMYSTIISPPLFGRDKGDVASFEHGLANYEFKIRLRSAHLRC